MRCEITAFFIVLFSCIFLTLANEHREIPTTSTVVSILDSDRNSDRGSKRKSLKKQKRIYSDIQLYSYLTFLILIFNEFVREPILLQKQMIFHLKALIPLT